VIRKVAIGIWILIIAACIGSYLIWPDFFTPESIAALLTKFQNEALLIFLLLSMLRGLSLLPSTPLVLAGAMMFPTQQWLVLAVSIFGILVSSSMIYWFSDLLGFTEFFKKRNPARLEKIRTKLEHPAGSFFVMLWAFFPFVPTDAVCYVAGTTRMHFAKFLAAIFVGEVILCACYVFGGGQLLKGWFA